MTQAELIAETHASDSPLGLYVRIIKLLGGMSSEEAKDAGGGGGASTAADASDGPGFASPHCRTVLFFVQEGRAEEFADLYAKTVMSVFTRQPGCMQYTVVHNGNDSVFSFIVFSSKDALNAAVKVDGLAEAKEPLKAMNTREPVFTNYPYVAGSFVGGLGLTPA